jgi:uncharacterized protein (TIGR04562 family)
VAKSDRRIPVISDPGELNIPWRTLQTIIAGRSLIDTFELNIENLDEACKFLNSYGIQNNEDGEKLLKTALEYIENVLLKETSLCPPEKINSLTLPELMLEASAGSKSTISEWSCVILKVCHAVAHAQWTRDEDAQNAALIKIKARLKPFIIESQDGIWIGDDNCRIPVVEYKVKARKKIFRIVTKLLLKEGNLSARIYDHIGVRIVTHDIFSAILLIKFLRSRHIFMYANVLPQKSKNSMAEFHQIEELFAEFSTPIQHTVMGESKGIRFGSKNPYSSKEFKMIKIIERILVTTSSGRKVFSPCEFQILTKQTHESLSKKQIDHAAYEKRQIRGVKNRLFDGTSLLGGP